MTGSKANAGFTAEERAAMAERAREVRAAKKGADAEKAVLDAIAKMTGDDQEIARKLHEIVRATAPQLEPKTFYGSPGYARNGKVVLFFQDRAKFHTRYCTLGFQEAASLDDGDFWPTSFAVAGWSPAVEAEVTRLVARAAR